VDKTFPHSFLSGIDVSKYPFSDALAPILLGPVGFSSAGYPYLEAHLFRELRDNLPLLFKGGQEIRNTVDMLSIQAENHLDTDQKNNVLAAATVIRTILNTAAVTAPPDLWLLRQVLHTWKELDVLQPILSQDGIVPDACGLLEPEFRIDLTFLLSRGYLREKDGRYYASKNPQALSTLQEAAGSDHHLIRSTPGEWTRFFNGESQSETTLERLHQFVKTPYPSSIRRDSWCATWSEIELGYRWVPILLGLSQSPKVEGLLGSEPIVDVVGPWQQSPLGNDLLEFMRAAGVITGEDDQVMTTSIGRRVFKRAAGPFGIIQAYQPYMENLSRILHEGRKEVHVQRGPNVAASQLANRSSFEKANKSLDRFCTDTGFTYKVYIEHALGRGEATRQRFEQAGDQITYIGADLEQASIDSAKTEQSKGHLPKAMRFLAGADIGQPSILLDYLNAENVSPQNAVMVVGNGFHEVRGQTDERLIEIFGGYHEAGLILLFTEESALCVANLLETAWNTYHAGFKYLHERSGQGLRPARKGPPPSFGPTLPLSWNECAVAAGYVALNQYTTRTRTIFPYAPKNGFNPAISVNHFFIPGPLAKSLGLA
jgi:hypothetical protein